MRRGVDVLSVLLPLAPLEFIMLPVVGMGIGSIVTTALAYVHEPKAVMENVLVHGLRLVYLLTGGCQCKVGKLANEHCGKTNICSE